MQFALISELQAEPELELSPAMTGALLAIGIFSILAGIRSLRAGITKEENGDEYGGGKEKLIGSVALVLGVFAVGAGLFRLITG